MTLNSGIKKKPGNRDLFSLDNLGSTIFLVLAGFFFFLVVVGGLSQMHKGNAPVLSSHCAQEAARGQVQNDLGGALPTPDAGSAAVSP